MGSVGLSVAKFPMDCCGGQESITSPRGAWFRGFFFAQ
ncbi:hypothetical protein F0726_00441 [Acidithiobacillus caldus]|nr:hypothetical protein F0726_00441 [Acidithiobacillus caldus]